MAPISENTAYQAAHRALTDVYDAPLCVKATLPYSASARQKSALELSWNGSMRICYVFTSKLQIWRTL